MNTRVAIIGGGVGGISAVKECLDEGLEPVCFEQHDQIGGLWYYTEKSRPNQGAAIYPSLITNTSKCMTEFSDFPMPKHYPPYLPHNLLYEYIQNYVEHFRLRDYFHLGTEVVKVKRSSDHDATGNWDVTFKPASNTSRTDQTTETFARVIIATGLNKSPYMPDIPGQDAFTGRIIHSRDFRRAEAYQNQTVLVIGNANSAGDVAVDVSHQAKVVYMCVGDGMYVMSRTARRGIPPDLLLSRFVITFVPNWLQTFILKQVVSRVVDHETYSIKCAENNPYKAAVCMNDEIVWRMTCGKVVPKTYAKELTARGVIFQDGSRVDDVDAVIFATGYSVDYGLVDDGAVCDAATTRPQDLDLYKNVWPPGGKHNSLAVVGMHASLGPSPLLHELQCRWIAQVFAGKMKLPSQPTMVKHIARDKDIRKDVFGNKFRMPPHYREELADIIGVRPKFWSQLLPDPVMAFKCFFGPAFPVHYRLTGPHAWSGARQAALDAYENTVSGLRTREVPTKAIGRGRRRLVIVLSIACLVGAAMAFYCLQWNEGLSL